MVGPADGWEADREFRDMAERFREHGQGWVPDWSLASVPRRADGVIEHCPPTATWVIWSRFVPVTRLRQGRQPDPRAHNIPRGYSADLTRSHGWGRAYRVTTRC